MCVTISAMRCSFSRMLATICSGAHPDLAVGFEVTNCDLKPAASAPVRRNP